jgi:hypothetical protein
MGPNHLPERELRLDVEPHSAAMFQDAVMRLCLDATLRASCIGSPAQLASHFPGLGNAGWVAEACGRELARFATGLVNKRWSEVGSVLEVSRRVSPQLGSLYKAWLSKHPPRAEADSALLSPGPREAERALEPLCQALQRHAAHADYAVDVLRFEVLGRCSGEDKRRRTVVTQVAVHEWWSELRRGVLPVDPPHRPTRYTFGDRVEWSSLS